jgi:hypothetical protein
MKRTDQAQAAGAPRPLPAPESHPPAGRPGEFAYRAAAAAVAVLAASVGLMVFLCVPPPDGGAQNGAVHAGVTLFRGWGKPDVALVLTGQQHGYLQPCGCSHPQYGGLTRRYNFLQTLKARGWPLVAVDLGDIPDEPTKTSPQTLKRYEYSMKALKLMDYTAVSFGVNEMRLPLDDALGNYALNNPSPRVVAANLLDREKAGDRFHETVASWEVGGKAGAPRVGVLGLVSQSVENEGKDRTLRFHPKTAQVLQKALAELRGKGAELFVLLYQGKPSEARRCAEFCARQRKTDPRFPRVDVILCLTEEEAPPGGPDVAGESLLVRVGHKGRYLGVLGAFRTGKADHPWQLKYQLVEIGPEYETAKGKEKNHPVMDLLEEYALHVKEKNYLAKFRRRPHSIQVVRPKAEYVGSGECKSCHKQEYEVWYNQGLKEDKGHARAYHTLVEVKHPKNRQYDGECVQCHVVGFGYEKGFTDEIKTPHLKDVGCESCHGPCSEHVRRPRDAEIRKLINPYRYEPNEAPHKRVQRLNQIDSMCQKCHDIDNSVDFKFPQYWAKIVHPSPRRPPRVEAPAGK